jgi:hypothetical protein
MRDPVHSQHFRRGGEARVEIGTIGGAHPLDAVLWEVGLVLAVFLGLVLTASATLTAFGVN